MAKVTLTFRDKKNGKVGVDADFSPKLKKGATGRDLTDAQVMAAAVLQGLQKMALDTRDPETEN